MEEEVMEMMERLDGVVAMLEAAAAKLAEQQGALAAAAEEQVGRITATVESAREAELERRLAEAEAKLTELRANAAPVGRKTLGAGMTEMLAKQDVAVDGRPVALEASALLDAALSSLSVEQRIAVKAEMLRAGLLR